MVAPQVQGPPMGAAMPMPAQQAPLPQANPFIDLARLQELWAATTPPQPVYPSWYRQPKRPNAQRVAEEALRRFDELSEWRMAVRHDLLVLRGAVEGIFDADLDDYYAGIMDPWSSPALIDELNLAVSWLAGLQHRFKKPQVDEKYRYETRTVELAAQWLYQAEMRQDAEMLDMDPSLLPFKVLLPYGRLVTRRTLNRTADPWESPFVRTYIDPAQVVAVRGGKQVEKVYRLYSATAEQLQADYGEFSEATRKKLKDLHGEIEDTTEFTNVVEYWDTWYRCVTVGGVEIIPVTEHKYGEVPYSIGYGPLGEPQFTTLPETSAGSALSRETMRANAPHKSVGFIRFMEKQHAQYEAMMKRNLYSWQMQNNPAVIRYRSSSAAQRVAPELVAQPGAQNEAIFGEEKLEPFPYANRNQFDQSVLMDAMTRDRQTGRAPLSAYGVFDQSNISGTATKMGLSAGAHLWKPWASHYDRFVEKDIAKAFRLWQRLGHTVEYAGPQRRPFVVPNERPMKGEPGSFELTRECLDRVGPYITVKSDSQDTSDWAVRGQAAKLMNDLGIPKPEVFDRLFSLTYDEQMAQEWLEEQSLAVAMQNPKFVEIIGVPAMIASELTEAEGDPDRTALLQTFLKGWMQVVVQPAMMEQQLQMGQMQGQAMQMQQQAAGMVAPTNQQSFTEMGRGPGSKTGQQGGPTGPTGPRSQGAAG